MTETLFEKMDITKKTLCRLGKGFAHKRRTWKMFSYVQPVTRGLKHYCFRTTQRQVSRLIDHRIRHLPGFPVIYRFLLLNYGDEFVQDLHLFPFSPEPIIHIFLESLLWHLTAPYLFFGYYSIYHLKLQIILIILYSINFLKSSVGSKPSTFIIPIA